MPSCSSCSRSCSRPCRRHNRRAHSIWQMPPPNDRVQRNPAHRRPAHKAEVLRQLAQDVGELVLTRCGYYWDLGSPTSSRLHGSMLLSAQDTQAASGPFMVLAFRNWVWPARRLGRRFVQFQTLACVRPYETHRRCRGTASQHSRGTCGWTDGQLCGRLRHSSATYMDRRQSRNQLWCSWLLERREASCRGHFSGFLIDRGKGLLLRSSARQRSARRIVIKTVPRQQMLLLTRRPRRQGFECEPDWHSNLDVASGKHRWGRHKVTDISPPPPPTAPMARGRALSFADDTSADVTPAAATRTRARQTARRSTRKTPVPFPCEEPLPEAEPILSETEDVPEEDQPRQQRSASLRSRLSARFSAQPSASRTSRPRPGSHQEVAPVPDVCGIAITVYRLSAQTTGMLVCTLELRRSC